MISENMVRPFFYAYANHMNNSLLKEIESEAITGAFSDYFVGASPAGVLGGSNDERFRQVIEEGVRFYKRIGVRSMNVLSCDVAILDEYHAMATIGWQCVYEKPPANSGEILFTVRYLVQQLDKAVRIFAYITGDEQKALREKGLV
jgi:hypothetical protein